MKIYFFFLWAMLASSLTAMARVPFDAPSPQKGVSSGVWNFRNKEQLRKAIDQWGQTPRGGYYIINQSARVKLIPEAVRYYNELSLKAMNQQKPSAVLNVLYAYAATVEFEGLFAGSSSERMSGDIRIQLDRKKRPKAYDLNSAEIEVMRGALALFQFCDKGQTTKAQWDGALIHFRRAAKYAPQWADTHYWNGKFWSEYSSKWGPFWPEPTKQLFAQRAKWATLRAKRMNPSLPFQGSCAMQLSVISHEMGQHRESLKYLHEVFRYLPEWKDERRLSFEKLQRSFIQSAEAKAKTQSR